MRDLLLLLIPLAACGGSDPAAIDAPAAGADAYDTTRCLITGTYGALGAKTGTTAQGATTLTIVLDPGPPGKDDLFLKLNAGKGVFAGGLANGTFPLMGADLDFSNCGLCVNLIADIVPAQGPSKFYFADAGTVTLTSTSPPAGMLANVTFHEVTAAGAAVAGGCKASIASLSFSM